jgi:hypothetical protein
MEKDGPHSTRMNLQYAVLLKKHLDVEKQANADLKELLGDVRKKKKSLKKQVEKLTWIARATLGIDELEAMLDEPVDFGYKKPKKCTVYERPTPMVIPRTTEFLRKVETEKLASSSPAPERTVYADEEEDEEDEDVPPKLEEPKIPVRAFSSFNGEPPPLLQRWTPAEFLYWKGTAAESDRVVGKTPTFAWDEKKSDDVEKRRPHWSSYGNMIVVDGPGAPLPASSWEASAEKKSMDNQNLPALIDSDDESLPELAAAPVKPPVFGEVIDVFSEQEKVLLQQYEPLGEYTPPADETAK